MSKPEMQELREMFPQVKCRICDRTLNTGLYAKPEACPQCIGSILDAQQMSHEKFAWLRNPT